VPTPDSADDAPARPIAPLRIAQVAPPLERVPPAGYGGTERVVFDLTAELVRRGHDVTVFASGDSEVPCRLVPTVEAALRPSGFGDDPSPYFLETLAAVFTRGREFDVVHSHLEWWSLALARGLAVPVASTFHGRLDLPWSRRLLAGRPSGLVAISRSQASVHPDVDWTIIHNGLALAGMPTATVPTDAFSFVGRVEASKGILEAIEIAQLAGRPLRIAAKIGTTPDQRAYYEDVFRPALARAGSGVEFLGELDDGDRDRLLAESFAALMPGAWPEPFGLVAIEALACGTPILARRVGALPEIIRDGIDGFFGDDPMHLAFLAEGLPRLDRRAIRERVIERFSAARMADRYEELFVRLVAESRPGEQVSTGHPSPRSGVGAGAGEPRTGIFNRGDREPAAGEGPADRPVRPRHLAPVGPGRPGSEG
jgi:glycosyltransferase involved in cell wall biosynthesis